MEKLVLISFVLLFFTCKSNCQKLTDEQAIIQTLKGVNIDGKFTWRPRDKSLKEVALRYMMDYKVEVSTDGARLVSYILTGEEYDSEYDSLFLSALVVRLGVDSLFERTDFIRNHFVKSNYSKSTLQKISWLVNPERVLSWKSWTPYYIAVLNLKGADKALKFLKDNIDPINELHFNLHGIPFRFDIREIDISLARIGNLSDSTLVDQLYLDLRNQAVPDYKDYIESLSQIRTQYSFKKIGDLLLDSEKDRMGSSKESGHIQEMALAAFLAYVKNFPDRSTKWQDVFDLWGMVKFLTFQGKDFSTEEYLKLARNWYTKNKANLILDLEKY